MHGMEGVEIVFSIISWDVEIKNKKLYVNLQRFTLPVLELVPSFHKIIQ